ncbi:MAG: Ig-like domain-containing protein, partial [Halobacteria archaeon]|nr:Ig-like domain-containing protein [Halobacteria archaeon]
EDEYYLTVSEGNNVSVGEGSSQTLVAQVRDRYNNPVSGVEVEFHLDGGGDLSSTTATSDEDGEATVVYDAPALDTVTSTSVLVNASISE